MQKIFDRFFTIQRANLTDLIPPYKTVYYQEFYDLFFKEKY